MEEELDDIAEGKLGWIQVLDEFYGPFERLLEKKEDEIERFSEDLDEECPKCREEGRPNGKQIVKLGRYGKFVSCSNYPDCDYKRNLGEDTRPEPELLDEACPECGKQLVSRVGRYGPFIGCSGYPECRYIKKQEKKTGVACPECKEGELVVKRTRKGKTFYGCNRYPECSFAVWSPPAPDPCPTCGSLMVKQKAGIKCTQCDTVIPYEDPAPAAVEEAREG
jgi:DNA topoisomerase-1